MGRLWSHMNTPSLFSDWIKAPEEAGLRYTFHKFFPCAVSQRFRAIGARMWMGQIAS